MGKEPDQIHQAAEVLRCVLEKYIGSKAIVFYGAIEEGGEYARTGITISDEAASRDVEHLAFTLVARARDMIDYGDEPAN